MPLSFLLRVGATAGVLVGVAAVASSNGALATNHASAASPASSSLLTVGDVDAPSSLFDSLSFRTAALFRTSAHLSNLSFIDALTPSTTVSSVQMAILPSSSTLVACALAFLLYVLSWTWFASTRETTTPRGNLTQQQTKAQQRKQMRQTDETYTSDEAAATKESPTMPTDSTTSSTSTSSIPSVPLTTTPTSLRPLYAFFHLFLRCYQCCVFLIHAFLNRALPFRDCNVYLRGFACTQLPDDWTVSTERFRRCLASGTQVALADGRTKKVDDLLFGDSLLGINGRVARLVSPPVSGISQGMYRVEHRDGTSYTVTPGHRITLKWNRSTFVYSEKVKKGRRSPTVTIRYHVWLGGCPVVKRRSVSYLPRDVERQGGQRIRMVYLTRAAALAAANAFVAEQEGASLHQPCSGRPSYSVFYPITVGKPGKTSRTFTWWTSKSNGGILRMSEEEAIEALELWLEDAHPLADTSDGKPPREGSRLERGTVFDLEARKLYALRDELLYPDKTDAACALIVGYRESNTVIDRDAPMLVRTPTDQCGRATSDFVDACNQSILAAREAVPKATLINELAHVGDGTGSYSPVVKGSLIACIAQLHQPLVPHFTLDDKGKLSRTFNNLHRVLGELQISPDVIGRMVWTELNPVCGSTGTIDSSHEVYDSVCSFSLLAVLESGARRAVSFGVAARKRWEQIEQLVLGASIISTGTSHGVPYTRVSYGASDEIVVYHSPHPCISHRQAVVAQAMYLALGGDEAIGDGHFGQSQDLENSVRIKSVVKLRQDMKYVAVEVDGDSRFLLADGTVTHNTALYNFGIQDSAAEFCLKLLGRSGLGEQTYFPPGLLAYPPDLTMKSARAEADYVIGNALDQLFAQTGIHPRDVDILVVNCSLFAPTPSLAAMIIHKYKMREDINSYNLSGMGCSAGLISLHLAKDLLRTHPNSIAVIVSTELITQQIYTGVETNMLLQNSLFRSGGAAIALTNRSSDYAFGRAQYELEHTVRTTMAADTEAYYCVYQDEDSCGHRGVRLEKELMNVAGRAMNRNISRLGPKILPWSEQLKFFFNLVARTVDTKFRVLDKMEKYGLVAPAPALTPEQQKKLNEKEAQRVASQPGYKPKYKSRIEEYTPNFKKAVDHICIHAGGRAVIDAIQAGLKLSDEDVAPSRATLKRYGNTSSSSIWYEFRYCEQNRDIKQGEKIWQLGFGSGFKCNSAIWRKL